MEVKKGLIIKPKWADLILAGAKTIELRGNKTSVRGTIGVIKSGTKKVFGYVDIIDCIELSKEDYIKLRNKHKVNIPYEDIKYKKLYAWVLENPIVLSKPIPYNHKLGCVIWVNL